MTFHINNSVEMDISLEIFKKLTYIDGKSIFWEMVMLFICYCLSFDYFDMEGLSLESV